MAGKSVRNATRSVLLKSKPSVHNSRLISLRQETTHNIFSSLVPSISTIVFPRHSSIKDNDDDNDCDHHHHHHSNVSGNLFSRSSNSSVKTTKSFTSIRGSHTDRLVFPSSSTKALFHTSARNENTALALGLGAIALSAKAGQYALSAYQEYQQGLPEEAAPQDSNTTTTNKQEQQQTKSSSSSSSSSEERENMFHSWFGTGTKYYEGGFDEKMTRREAALILGVRESSSATRIKNAHRKILILNHPDTGGSTYIASKLNEAKELLLKGKEK